MLTSSPCWWQELALKSGPTRAARSTWWWLGPAPAARSAELAGTSSRGRGLCGWSVSSRPRGDRTPPICTRADREYTALLLCPCGEQGSSLCMRPSVPRESLTVASSAVACSRARSTATTRLSASGPAFHFRCWRSWRPANHGEWCCLPMTMMCPVLRALHPTGMGSVVAVLRKEEDRPALSPCKDWRRVIPAVVVAACGGGCREPGPRGIIDEFMHASTADSIRMTRLLATQEGLLVGPSSGAACKCAIDLASREEMRGKCIVVVFPSSGTRYLQHEMFKPFLHEGMQVRSESSKQIGTLSAHCRHSVGTMALHAVTKGLSFALSAATFSQVSASGCSRLAVSIDFISVTNDSLSVLPPGAEPGERLGTAVHGRARSNRRGRWWDGWGATAA